MFALLAILVGASGAFNELQDALITLSTKLVSHSTEHPVVCEDHARPVTKLPEDIGAAETHLG
jgi:hypothetical protein